jgi:hypothetical protein
LDIYAYRFYKNVPLWHLSCNDHCENYWILDDSAVRKGVWKTLDL